MQTHRKLRSRRTPMPFTSETASFHLNSRRTTASSSGFRCPLHRPPVRRQRKQRKVIAIQDDMPDRTLSRKPCARIHRLTVSSGRRLIPGSSCRPAAVGRSTSGSPLATESLRVSPAASSPRTAQAVCDGVDWVQSHDCSRDRHSSHMLSPQPPSAFWTIRIHSAA